MTWTGIEQPGIEQHLRGAEEPGSPSEPSAEVEDGDGDGDEVMEGGDDDDNVAQPPPFKRIKIVGAYAHSGGATEDVQRTPRDETQLHGGNGDGNGNGNVQVYEQGQQQQQQQQQQQVALQDRVPHFKPDLAEPDDKGENECFFDTCATRAGGTAYLMKHLRDKHGLVRGDQGRPEGGKRKAPKYLTLCPTNWPFKHNSTSSCKACEDIAGVSAVLGQGEHESASICSFCWAYLPTRRDLVAHVDQGPCRSHEMFTHKVALVRHMYAETLRIPGADEISRAAAGQRQAHAEAERQARSERWQYEQQAMQAWTEQIRGRKGQPQQQQQQQQPRGANPAYVQVHTDLSTPMVSEAPQQQQQKHQQHQQQSTPAAYSHQRFTPSATASPSDIPHPHPPPPQPGLGPAPPPTAPYPVPLPTHANAAVDIGYAITSVTAEAMARSIERLSTAVAELTAANTRLVQDVRAKDGQLAARDDVLRQKDERLQALSAENGELLVLVKRLRGEVEMLGRGGGGVDGDSLGGEVGG
ncbi:hypothetical protein N658DRAFT_524421 [Parathielavia hyrcaniae]|uniref:Uncharacterized protein n=1 Tax=Parathielavia hyrcaniae TaxID=113614 RepID=A0AAN6T0S4_9PEZI|nr:hypothetical protein N658DRAFT_524421 [Parathielavia hyrcaniae]